MGKHPIIYIYGIYILYRALTIQGGAGFRNHINHPQYHVLVPQHHLVGQTPLEYPPLAPGAPPGASFKPSFTVRKKSTRTCATPGIPCASLKTPQSNHS